MLREVLPYRTAGSVVELTLTTVSLSGSTETIEPRFPLIISGLTWTQCDLEIAVKADPGEILKSLPEAERRVEALRPLARLRGQDTRLRAPIQLEPDGSGNWKGAISFRRPEVRGRLAIDALFVRASTGPYIEGYARDAGARLAWSEPGLIQTDYVKPVGDYIDVRYEGFKSSDRPLLRDSAEHAYVLDLTGAEPILFLNTDVPGLQRVLDSHTTVGRIAAVRNTLNHSIGQAVWLELIMSAAGAVEGDSIPEGWRGAVLRRAAKWLDPSGAVEPSIREIGQMLSQSGEDQSSRDYFLTRLSGALQRGVPVQRSIRGLLSALEE